MSVSECLKIMDKHATAAIKAPLLSAEEVRRITQKLGMCPDNSKPERTTPKQYQCKYNRKEWLKGKITKYKAELKKMEEANICR